MTNSADVQSVSSADVAQIKTLTKKLLGEGIVERGRLGEQNSQAMIDVIGQGARAGDPKYKIAYKMVMDYMLAHPNKDPGVGADVKKALSAVKSNQASAPATLATLKALPASGDPKLIGCAIVALSRGPRLTVDRIALLDAACSAADQPFFQSGVAASNDSKALAQIGADAAGDSAIGALCAGHCVGTARRIQMVAAGESVGILSRGIAWEFGCGA